ncbi:transposase [Bacillus sp. IT-79MI2]|nr:hypothetical protein BTH41_00686 [Bacillus mycoides]
MHDAASFVFGKVFHRKKSDIRYIIALVQSARFSYGENQKIRKVEECYLVTNYKN